MVTSDEPDDLGALCLLSLGSLKPHSLNEKKQTSDHVKVEIQI